MCVCMVCTVAHRRGVCRITPQNYKLSRIMVYATRYFFDTSFGLCAFLGFLNFCGWEVPSKKRVLLLCTSLTLH